MVNKRGFLRVVEATIAVIIILVAFVFLSAQRAAPESRDVGTVLPGLLDEVARNLTLREEVAGNYDEDSVESSIELTLNAKLENPSVNLAVEICNITEVVCFLEPYPDTESDIFASERVISSSIKDENFNPKKVKVFLWRNSP
jgi:hypothetical protein